MSWWHVEGTVTSTELVLPPGAVSTKHIFGIGLQMNRYSSEIVWQACTYQWTSSLYSAFYTAAAADATNYDDG